MIHTLRIYEDKSDIYYSVLGLDKPFSGSLVRISNVTSTKLLLLSMKKETKKWVSTRIFSVWSFFVIFSPKAWNSHNLHSCGAIRTYLWIHSHKVLQFSRIWDIINSPSARTANFWNEMILNSLSNVLLSPSDYLMYFFIIRVHTVINPRYWTQNFRNTKGVVIILICDTFLLQSRQFWNRQMNESL